MKRVRIVAGPNGSGKTTGFNNLRKEYNFKTGIYVNADEIESSIRKFNELNFIDFELTVNIEELKQHFLISTFSPVKRNEPLLYQSLEVVDNVLKINTNIDSYLAADIAEFIRYQLVKNGIPFTFETVMSDSNKIKFIQECRSKGYKIYLYFFSTQDPKININRVNIRVANDGHSVPEEKIISRYYKSLSNLKSAVKNSDKAYIFDNTGEKEQIIAFVEKGKNLHRNPDVAIPEWVETYLFE